VDPAPATITAVLAMHAGHICPSSELLNRVHGVHVQILMQVSNGQGVTSVAGFRTGNARDPEFTRAIRAEPSPQMRDSLDLGNKRARSPVDSDKPDYWRDA
jgi:hypothetical protein